MLKIRWVRGLKLHQFARTRVRKTKSNGVQPLAFQTELVGKAVILTDGKAGTVENVWLDELHGLRISIRGHDGKWPVSTVKLTQN